MNPRPTEGLLLSCPVLGVRCVTRLLSCDFNNGNREVRGRCTVSQLTTIILHFDQRALGPEITGNCLFGLGQGCDLSLRVRHGSAQIVPALSTIAIKHPGCFSIPHSPPPSSLPPFLPHLSLSSLSFLPSTSLFLTPVSIVHLKRVLSKRSTTLTLRLTDEQ